jgi:hypothetical protein
MNAENGGELAYPYYLAKHGQDSCQKNKSQQKIRIPSAQANLRE